MSKMSKSIRCGVQKSGVSFRFGAGLGAGLGASLSLSLSQIVAIIGISIPIYPSGTISKSTISIITVIMRISVSFGLRLSHNSGYSESYDKLEWD